jgi:hypothetical protein
MRRANWRWPLVLLALLVALGATAPTTRAQSDVVYFPETGHYLRGAFLSFWQTRGDVYIFGLPITEEYVRQSDGRIVQYFEKARFELLVVNNQATVILGQLGRQATAGRSFPQAQPIPTTRDKRYIEETGYIIQYGFKEIWETRGGAPIFGFPLSNEIKEITDDGRERTVQYFENFRFEYWPEFAPGQRVLFTRLGSRYAPPQLTAPLPPNAPPAGPVPENPNQPAPTPAPAPAPAPTPAPDPNALPANINAVVEPQIGPPGTTFVFGANGFEDGEPVGVWVNAPDQSVIGADFQVTADDSGSIGYAGIGIETTADFPEGVYSFVAQGVDSKRQAIGYFRIRR